MAIILSSARRKKEISSRILKERIKKLPREIDDIEKYLPIDVFDKIQRENNEWFYNLTTDDSMKLKEEIEKRYRKKLERENAERKRELERKEKLEELEKTRSEEFSNLWKEMLKLKEDVLTEDSLSAYEGHLYEKKYLCSPEIQNKLEEKEKKYLKSIYAAIKKRKEDYKEFKSKMRKWDIKKEKKEEILRVLNRDLEDLKEYLKEREEKIEKRKKLAELKHKAIITSNKNLKLAEKFIPEYFEKIGSSVKQMPKERIGYLYHGVSPTEESTTKGFAEGYGGRTLTPEEYVKKIKKIAKEGFKPPRVTQEHSDPELPAVYFLDKPSHYGAVNLKIDAKDIKKPVFKAPTITAKPISDYEIMVYGENLKVPFKVFLKDPAIWRYPRGEEYTEHPEIWKKVIEDEDLYPRDRKEHYSIYLKIKDELKKEGFPIEVENGKTRKVEIDSYEVSLPERIFEIDKYCGKFESAQEKMDFAKEKEQQGDYKSVYAAYALSKKDAEYEFMPPENKKKILEAIKEESKNIYEKLKNSPEKNYNFLAEKFKKLSQDVASEYEKLQKAK